jgi:CHAT domain-containing protein
MNMKNLSGTLWGRLLIAGMVVGVAGTVPGCALLQRLTGKSVPIPGSVNVAGNYLPASAAQSVAATTSALRGGNLNSLAVSLGVPAAVALGRLAAKGIATAVERRAEERARKQQAAQQFYAGVCAREGAPKFDEKSPEGQAEAAFNSGDYAGAEKFLSEAVKKHEAEGKAGNEALGRALNKLGALYLAKSDLQKGEQAAKRSLEVREKALGKDHPDVAESLGTVAAIAQAKSDYGAAEPLYQRALKIREQELKEDHICVAQSVNQLAGLYKDMAAYSKAEPLYQRALTIRTSKLGEQSLEVAESNGDLGALMLAMGNFAAAEPYYQRALEVRKAKLGEDHPEVAETLNELGNLSKQRGDFPQAETRLKQALAIREKKLPPTDPKVAETLGDLASLYVNMGDLRAAEPLLRRALELRQKALGADHPDVAETMGLLAQLLRQKSQLAEAETLTQKALQIRETKLGLRHPQVAESCSDMGDLQLQKGDAAKAESFYNRAFDVRKQVYGAEHPAVAQSMFKQATLLRARGDLARALPLYQQALQLREKLLGPGHPDVAESLVGVAAAQIGSGKTDAALPLLTRAVEIDEVVLRSIGGSSNESRVDAFLRTLRTQEEIIYSLLTESPSEAAVNLGAMTALLRKGRSIDEAADTSRALYQGLKDDEKQKLAALREVKTRRADLALAGAGVYPPDVYQKLLRDLQDSEEQQQAELVKSSASLRSKLQAVKPQDVVASVQKALPGGSALFEVVAFPKYTFKPTAQKPALGPGPLHYVAIVLTNEGKPLSFDLGPGSTIDSTIGNLLAALTNPESDWEEPAKALKQLVLAPAREGLAKSAKWFVSPDAQLSLVPFGVLPLAEGKLTLVDKIELIYVTSGRDLLRRHDGEGAKTSVAVLADPQFSLATKNAAAADAGQSRASGIYRGLRLGKVAPLPGTRQEAKAIEKLLKKNDLSSLMGDKATKQAFLKIEQPGILHAATHGLFIGETSKSGDNSRGVVIDEEEARPAPQPTPTAAAAPRPIFAENPLLSSMLVMAGAETASKLPAESREPEIGNGLVTALEVASMNLWGTQLVVLSACETGRGDVSNLGQGVYGLRRAVMVAGAQTLLTSLWKVDDKATKDLMSRYYKNLLSGQGRAEAMRAAALFVRKKRPHPYFWAPFITIGRSTPLSGIGKPSAAASEPAEDDDEDDKKDDKKSK